VRKQIAQTALATIIGGSLLSFGAIFLEMYAAPALSFFVEPWVLNAVSSATLIIGISIISLAGIGKRPDLQLRYTGIELILLLLLVVFTAGIVISAATPFEFTFRFVLLLLLVIYGAMALRTFAREMWRLKEIESLHDRLTQLNAVLMRADRLKTRFVSFASHQLRAPLGGIRGYLDMMNRGDFGAMTDPQKRVIGLNLDAVNRLTQTIEMFLDVTKIELGKLDLYVTPTALGDVITKSVAEMKPLADKKGLVIKLEIPATLPMVQCDSAKIFHVMANFIDNAIKYTPTGSVTVRAREEGGFLVVEVVDTGIGMDQTDRSRLFHLFERGISAVKLESSGEGLGLYIVKNIIDAHGGTVFIESAGKEKGSTFGFRLPL
jgi:signal transduction histidine kinase